MWIKFIHFSSAECQDNYKTCISVVKAKLCTYEYYIENCCASCKEAVILGYWTVPCLLWIQEIFIYFLKQNYSLNEYFAGEERERVRKEILVCFVMIWYTNFKIKTTYQLHMHSDISYISDPFKEINFKKLPLLHGPAFKGVRIICLHEIVFAILK